MGHLCPVTWHLPLSSSTQSFPEHSTQSASSGFATGRTRSPSRATSVNEPPLGPWRDAHAMCKKERPREEKGCERIMAVTMEFTGKSIWVMTLIAFATHLPFRFFDRPLKALPARDDFIKKARGV